MNRKIIIKTDDLNREICSLLTEIGVGIPINWNMGALDCLRTAVVEAFGKMGVRLEIDERPQFPLGKQEVRGMHC